MKNVCQRGACSLHLMFSKESEQGIARRVSNAPFKALESQRFKINRESI